MVSCLATSVKIQARWLWKVSKMPGKRFPFACHALGSARQVLRSPRVCRVCRQGVKWRAVQEPAASSRAWPGVFIAHLDSRRRVPAYCRRWMAVESSRFANLEECLMAKACNHPVLLLASKMRSFVESNSINGSRRALLPKLGSPQGFLLLKPSTLNPEPPNTQTHTLHPQL